MSSAPTFSRFDRAARAALLSILVVGAGASLASAQGGPPRNGQSFFLRAEGGLCVDIQGGKLEPFTAVQLWNCHGRAPQLFTYDPRAQEVRVTVRPNLCVEIERSPEPVQRLHLVRCNGQDQSKQRWSYNGQTGVMRTAEGECWDVPRGNYQPGQDLVGNRCRPNALSQQFVLNDAMPSAPPQPRVQAPPPPVPMAPAARRPMPGKSFYIVAEGADEPSLCPDIAGGQMRAGVPIQLWKCHQQAPQRFGLNPNIGLVFVTAAPTLCVDGDAQQQLRLTDCNAVRNQWFYDRRSNTIRSSNGLCWDIAGGNVPNNIRQRQRIIAYPCHNRINQQFVLND